jgi:phosphohistidine phosphatase
MEHNLRYRIGHPVESALDLLAGSWRPAVLQRLGERLLPYPGLRKLIPRLKVDAPPPPAPPAAAEVAPGAEPRAAKAARRPAARPAEGRPLQLYVVRHGIAVEPEGGMPDGSRPLTAKGRRRFRKTARAFGKLGYRLDLILTSPLVRAVQTAEILAGAADPGEVDVLEELGPDFDPEAARGAIAARAGEAATVAIVGHEPQLSSLLSALSGVPRGDIDLKKGAIVRMDASSLADGAAAEPRWWLKPKGTRVKGLPLREEAPSVPVSSR